MRIRQDDAKVSWRLRKTVVLVGMPGAGKTAVGTALARRLGVPFRDSDEEIVRAANMSIAEIFAHMFRTLDEPRFVVTGQVLQGRQCFLTWDFLFRFRRFDTARTQVVRGATHIVLDDAGQVCQHRDYWDAAEELYEKLPVVGRLMRWLKHRANS